MTTTKKRRIGDDVVDALSELVGNPNLRRDRKWCDRHERALSHPSLKTLSECVIAYQSIMYSASGWATVRDVSDMANLSRYRVHGIFYALHDAGLITLRLEKTRLREGHKKLVARAI